jgi:Malectin domain
MIKFCLLTLCYLLAYVLPAYSQTWPVVIDSGSTTDVDFVGGQTTTLTNPPANVVDTTARYGNFSYVIPVTSAAPYVVTFGFLEQSVGSPGQRLFQIKINDQVEFDMFDILATCGWLTPCSRSVVVVPQNGVLNIAFVTEVRNAIVSSVSYQPLLVMLAAGSTTAWNALVAPCNQANNPSPTTSSCAGMYLLNVVQPNGTTLAYVATPATAAMVSSPVWQQ